MPYRLLVFSISVVCALGIAGCDHPSLKPPTAPPARRALVATLPSTQPQETSVSGPVLLVGNLHQVHRLTPSLYCGSVPDTDEAFAGLKALGIKTILSVDGMAPRVDLADKQGLRYVHLPFGYDGIPRERELEIARAVHDLPGPLYVHCHHGLHRGPAAAVVAAEATAQWTPEQAVAALREIGTSPQYEGLYAAARDFRRPTDAELAGADVSFPRVAKLNDLSETMVQIDQRWDHLKTAQKAGWKKLASQPDVDPPHEALLLKELLREGHRSGGPARDRPADLLERLTKAETDAGAIEDALRRDDPHGADAAAKTLQADCAACHVRYRNPALKIK